MRFLFNKFFYDWLSVCLSPRSFSFFWKKEPSAAVKPQTFPPGPIYWSQTLAFVAKSYTERNKLTS